MDVFVQPRERMERSVRPIEQHIVDQCKYNELKQHAPNRGQWAANWHLQRLCQRKEDEVGQQRRRNEMVDQELNNNILNQATRRVSVVLDLPLVHKGRRPGVQHQHDKIVWQRQHTVAKAEDGREKQPITIWPSIYDGVPNGLHHAEDTRGF